MKTKLLILASYLTANFLLVACGDLNSRQNEGMTFTTTTGKTSPLSKASAFQGVWVKSTEMEKLETSSESLCLVASGSASEKKIELDWLEINGEGRLSFDSYSQATSDSHENIAQVSQRGFVKANEKLLNIEKNRFEKDLERCLKENLGMEKFYMSEEDFEQNFEVEGDELLVHYVHTSYYCENDQRVDLDEIEASTTEYKKIEKEELLERLDQKQEKCSEEP